MILDQGIQPLRCVFSNGEVDTPALSAAKNAQGKARLAASLCLKGINHETRSNQRYRSSHRRQRNLF